MKHGWWAVLAALCLIGSARAQTESKPKLDKASAERVAGMLEASGASYAKIADHIWVAKFKGAQKPEIAVLVIGHENMLILSCDIVEKAGYKLSPELMRQLLRFNDQFDRIKVGIADEEEIFARIDLSLRVVDAKELKENLDQISAGVDEIYGALKPHLLPAKK